jgi:hypothetical protein
MLLSDQKKLFGGLVGCLVLVKTKKVSTYFHIHMAAVSAWRYVVLVVEFALATPKQKRKHVAKKKRNRVQLQSCGVP